MKEKYPKNIANPTNLVLSEMFAFIHSTFDATYADQILKNIPIKTRTFLFNSHKNTFNPAKIHTGKKEYPKMLLQNVNPVYSLENKFKRAYVPSVKNMHSM